MQEKKPRNVVWNTVKILLAIFLLYLVISKTNYQQLALTKDSVSWQWAIVLFILFIIMSLLKAFQYYVLISNQQGYWSFFRVVIWQNAISNFIASSAGIASYMTMLKAEQDVKLTRSGVTFIITKFGDLLAICFYLGVSAVLVWKEIQPLRWLTTILVVGIIFGLAIFLITVLWRDRFVSSLERFLVGVRLERISLVKKVLGMLHSLAQEEQAPIFVMLRTGMLWSFVYMSVTMVSAFSSMQVFNVSIDIWPIIYVSALMQIVSFIPIQVFGGLGVSEVTTVYLYSIFGLGQIELSAVMLGYRALFYLMNGAIFLYIPLDALIRRYNTRHANKQNSSG